jgi:glycosyltransferase involved in cell wall biosynthesis
VLATLARLSPRAAAVVVNSEAGRRASEALGYRPRRWVSLPNGFDLVQFAPQPEARAPLRRALAIEDDAVLIGLIARFHPMKDHQTFLRAAARLHRDRPGVRFVLAGRRIDASNAALAAPIREHGLDAVVHLLGERDDIPHLTAALDVATCSSYSEGFPNAIGEAMACEVPCVATDVGDCRALLGDTGLIVPPRDPEALASAWGVAIDWSNDERQSRGTAARARLEQHFEIGAVARRYEALYDELADRPASM